MLIGPAFLVYPSLGLTAKLLLAAYVAWLAVKLWRTDTFAVDDRTVSRREVFLTTVLNPKGLVAAFTLFPARDEGIGWYALGYGGVVVTCCTAWVLLGAALGRATPGRYRRWLPRAGSAAMTVFAGVVVASALG
jgi:threonine/homoserine/homoserine lactone efflux protein